MFVIGDGYFDNGERAHELVVQAQLRHILIVFLFFDCAQGNICGSLLNLPSVYFENNEMVQKNYLDGFPFPFYILISDSASLLKILAEALRHWFEMIEYFSQ
jgi:midasin